MSASQQGNRYFEGFVLLSTIQSLSIYLLRRDCRADLPGRILAIRIGHFGQHYRNFHQVCVFRYFLDTQEDSNLVGWVEVSRFLVAYLRGKFCHQCRTLVEARSIYPPAAYGKRDRLQVWIDLHLPALTAPRTSCSGSCADTALSWSSWDGTISRTSCAISCTRQYFHDRIRNIFLLSN